MADVSRRGISRRVPPNSKNQGRGQLIIVTALSLAILFVTLALILNTAIYTENLATRSGDIGGATDAVRYHDAARVGVGGVIGYANANNNTSHSTLQSNLSIGVDDFRNHSSRLFASGDRAVEVTLDDSVNGTRIAQNDSNRNFTNRSGSSNWGVVEDVNNIREFRMNVSDEDLLGLLSDPFEVILDDGTNTWTMNISTDGTDIVVTVDGPTETGDCREAAAHVWINVTEGTFANEPCEPLTSIGDGLATPYEIRYEDGEYGSGTYSMIVENASLANDVEAGSNTHLHEDGAGQPFAAHAIYSANVTVVYETSRLYYNTSVRVAPGEADG